MTSDFGERLAELRQDRHLTQTELAQRAGIHPSQLHRYEAGTAEPSLGVLRGLALGLQVSADALVFADDSRVLVEDRLRSAFESTVYLSEHEQNTIAELIEAFVVAHVVKTRPRARRGPAAKGRSQR